MFNQEQQAIEARIRAFCTGQDILLTDLRWSPISASGEWGISTSFFQTAADEARAGRGKGLPVSQRAQEIAGQVCDLLVDQPGIGRREAVKGYLNLYFKTSEYARRVVDIILEQGLDFGRGAPQGERVMVEYANVNTHHSVHIGHARNLALGEALARIVQYAGYDTLRVAYPGDIGLSVITVLWAYDKFHRGQEPQGIHERGQWLAKIYVDAVKLLEPQENETSEQKKQREAYEAERRELYRRWDAGDPVVRKLWLETREWSLDELRDILHTLDIQIDVWFYESDVDEPAKQIAEELIVRGIADDERPQGGAVIVRIDEKLGLTKEKYRTNVILRADGTSLYLTKDLALARVKFEKYHADRSIYVVDVRQSLHLQQAFAILRLMGFPQAEKCHHLGYGFVSLPEGAMSARRGRVVLVKDVFDEAIRRVLAVESAKAPDLSEAEHQNVARVIGLGALVYSLISVDNNRDMVFDMDQALSFEGRTGPYIQNAHVRASSILRKAGQVPPAADFNYELSSHEVALIDVLARFPAAVQQSASEYRPLVMANYAYELANAFHSFYHSVPVIQSDSEAVRFARMRLVAAARQTLANALALLGITAPEVM